MTMTQEEALALQTDFNPDELDVSFDLKQLLGQLEAAASDGSAYFQTMLMAEKWRLCEWEGKDPKRSGRRVSLPGKPAQPYEGAPDHEVYHIQEHLNFRRLLRRAALAGGRVTVSPHEVSDDRRAGLLQSVLRWLNAGPEGEAIRAAILRAASYADRFNHSLLYVGWERQLGLRPLLIRREDALALVTAELQPPEQKQEQEFQMVDEAQAEQMLETPEFEPVLAALLFRSYPGLAQRGQEGVKASRKAAKALVGGDDEVLVYECYQRVNRPEVLGLRYGMDYLIPSNTANDPRLSKVPWVALWRPYSAAQLKARAAAEGWNEKWLEKVLKDHQGQPNLVMNHAREHTWSTNPRWRTSLLALEHTYFIMEVWEQASTADGCLAIHRTVLHPDCKDGVGLREVTTDWHGSYPFVAMSVDPDEALLLEPLSLPELLHTTQDAIKAQVDSRSAAAAFTTLPPRLATPGTENLKVTPAGYIPVSKGERVEFLTMPPPDGRSIEVERSLTSYSARLLGQPSETVPDMVSRLAAEDTSTTFLSTVSHVYWLVGQLLGQYMSPLEQQRITGTADVVTATAEDIRGSYDVAVSFDARSLSPEYVETLLKFGTQAVQVLDRRGDVNTMPMLRTLLNWLDPAMADASLPEQEQATQRQKETALAALNDILNGGAPPVFKGQNPGAQAQIIVDEIQRSPLRQQLLQERPQAAMVLGNYLKTLAANAVQQDENPTTGLTLGKDPLRQPTPAEQMAALLLGEPQQPGPGTMNESDAGEVQP